MSALTAIRRDIGRRIVLKNLWMSKISWMVWVMDPLSRHSEIHCSFVHPIFNIRHWSACYFWKCHPRDGSVYDYATVLAVTWFFCWTSAYKCRCHVCFWYRCVLFFTIGPPLLGFWIPVHLITWHLILLINCSRLFLFPFILQMDPLWQLIKSDPSLLAVFRSLMFFMFLVYHSKTFF